MRLRVAGPDSVLTYNKPTSYSDRKVESCLQEGRVGGIGRAVKRAV